MSEMNTKIYASQDWVEEKIASIDSTGGGGDKEPYIVTVEDRNGNVSFSASFNTMWAAYEEGRQVLVSYMGRDYIQPIFFADGVFDDDRGRRILVEWDDKKYTNSGNLEDADEIERHVRWFYSDEADIRELRTSFSIPHGITHFTGYSRNQVMSQYATTMELKKLSSDLKNNKSPNPEPIIIDGEEYDGSVKTEINTVRNWNELEGRPFGEGTTDVLTFDGNLAGAESLMFEEGVWLVKLSDYAPDPSALQGFTMKYGETVMPVTDFSIDGEATMWNAFPTDGGMIGVACIAEIPEDMEEMLPGITTGLYGMYADVEENALYISEVVLAYDGIKPIPEEYLPETVATKAYVEELLGVIENGTY